MTYSINTSEKILNVLLKDGMDLDLSNPNLKDTPKRIAKMYHELFKNEKIEFDGLTIFPNEENYDQIILLDNIHFVSTCSHHFLPFSGKAWFAYIPDQLLLGASKPSRIISHYSARPQLQENLNKIVVNFIENALKPKAIMLVLRAIHGCMSCRGVNQYDNSGMITSSIGGLFKTDPSAKTEALTLIELSLKM